MGEVEFGQLLWEPPADAREMSRMGRFLDRVERDRGLELPTYHDAWVWSVSELADF